MLISRHHHGQIPACPRPHSPQHSQFSPAPGSPGCRCSLESLCCSSPVSAGPSSPTRSAGKDPLPIASQLLQPGVHPLPPPLCRGHWLHGQQTPRSWDRYGHRDGSIPLALAPKTGQSVTIPELSWSTGAPLPFPNPPLNSTQGHPCFGLCPHGAGVRG